MQVAFKSFYHHPIYFISTPSSQLGVSWHYHIYLSPLGNRSRLTLIETASATAGVGLFIWHCSGTGINPVQTHITHWFRWYWCTPPTRDSWWVGWVMLICCPASRLCIQNYRRRCRHPELLAVNVKNVLKIAFMHRFFAPTFVPQFRRICAPK